jgi:hypothetical protein
MREQGGAEHGEDEPARVHDPTQRQRGHRAEQSERDGR